MRYVISKIETDVYKKISILISRRQRWSLENSGKFFSQSDLIVKHSVPKLKLINIQSRILYERTKSPQSIKMTQSDNIWRKLVIWNIISSKIENCHVTNRKHD